MSAQEERTIKSRTRICPECGWGYLETHPESTLWLKCPICAFCIQIGEKSLKMPAVDKGETKDGS